jgi:hypothetical protein
MTQDLTPEAVAKILRENCSCNTDTAPCGAEDECRNAFIAADMLEALAAKLAEVEADNADLRLNMDADLTTMCRERAALQAAEAALAAMTAERDEALAAWEVGQ